MRYTFNIQHLPMGKGPNDPIRQNMTTNGQLLPEGKYVAIPIAEYAAERNAIAKIGEAVQSYQTEYQTPAKQRAREVSGDDDMAGSGD